MRQTCVLTGMVLRTAPAGEYDRRITLLTRERGKATAFVRGARRPKSALQAATNLFCLGKFEAYAGRDAYTVVRADILNYFSELYTDVDRAYFGCYFLELADCFTQPNDDAARQLELLFRSLLALASKNPDSRLVRRIYELKTLDFCGVRPNVFSCARCGAKENLCWFHARERGVLCENCGGRGGVPLDPASLYTLQYIFSSPLKKLYTFQVTREVYAAVSAVADRYLRLYADRNLRTLPFLPE